MARVGWGLGEDEGQWTFPGFLGFLHFWVRCYDTVMEGRFTPWVGGKQSSGGRQIQCEKTAMGSDDWKAGMSLSHWDHRCSDSPCADVGSQRRSTF